MTKFKKTVKPYQVSIVGGGLKEEVVGNYATRTGASRVVNKLRDKLSTSSRYVRLTIAGAVENYR
jgi:hypothetical protein